MLSKPKKSSEPELNLNKEAGPVYRQVKAWAIRAIQEGHFRPGEIFPSEVELARRIQVARMTIRQATSELVAEGILIREQGKRSRVAPAKAICQFLELSGISHYVHLGLGHYHCRVLAAEYRGLPDVVAGALQVRKGGTGFFLERLRSLDHLNFGYETTWINKKLCPGLDRYDFSAESLYHVLKEIYHITPSYSDGVIDVLVAGAEQAALLGLNEGTPLLKVERTVFSSDDIPFQVNYEIYRGDRFRFAYKAGHAK
jgi:GntR family transcriptional regulator